jgi:hypothetical protein
LRKSASAIWPGTLVLPLEYTTVINAALDRLWRAAQPGGMHGKERHARRGGATPADKSQQVRCAAPATQDRV